MNNLFRTIIYTAFMVSLGFSIPSFSHAQNASICNVLKTTSDVALKKFDAHEPWMTGQKSGISMGIRAEFSRIEKGRASTRITEERDRANNFLKLRKSVSGTEDKQAVERFIANVTNAAHTRRTSIDGAYALYRATGETFAKEFEEEQKKSLLEYKNKSKDAFTQAISTCQTQSLVNAKQMLRTSLRASHDTFVSKTNASSLLARIKESRELYLTAVDEANVKFQASYDASLLKLKESLAN